MEYRDLFVVQWRNSEPRPTFSEPVYFFEYDGKNCAYSALGGVTAFLFWVVGVIHETTAQQQLDNEADDDFLDRVGVSYGFWGEAK
jgi:hypothetical protein